MTKAWQWARRVGQDLKSDVTQPVLTQGTKRSYFCDSRSTGIVLDLNEDPIVFALRLRPEKPLQPSKLSARRSSKVVGPKTIKATETWHLGKSLHRKTGCIVPSASSLPQLE